MDWQEITEDAIGAAIRVQKGLGPGMLENAYQACLTYELRNLGHAVQEEVALTISYEALSIPNAYRMDIVVDAQVVLELKTVEKLLPVHEAQLASYLRFSGHAVGLLLNFWTWPMRAGGIKRVINSRSASFPVP